MTEIATELLFMERKWLGSLLKGELSKYREIFRFNPTPCNLTTLYSINCAREAPRFINKGISVMTEYMHNIYRCLESIGFG